MNQYDIIMPSMGEGIIEVTLVKWLKEVGDSVEKDEPIAEVATDKVDTEVPSPESGVVSDLKFSEGQTIPVSDVFCILKTESGNTENANTDGANAKAEAASPNSAQQAESNKAAKSIGGESTHAVPTTPVSSLAPSNSPTMPPASSGVVSGGINGPKYPDGRFMSSPLVRKMAKEHRLDLGKIRGTGLNGRILKKDVEAVLDNPLFQLGASASPSLIGASENSSGENVSALAKKYLALSQKDGVEYVDGVAAQRQPMTRMRKLIAAHMIDSVRIAPHVTTQFEVDLSTVKAYRDKHNPAFKKREGFSLTYTTFFVAASAWCLKKFPLVNASVDGDDVLMKQDINIGVATAIDSGLIVPVVKKAGELNFLGLARSMNDKVIRARNKQLEPDDVKGGTFTITNPGGYGCLQSNPIINQPQVAILSVGCIADRVCAESGAIMIKPKVIIGLTFDHRVIDGEGGAKFLAEMRNYLESFDEPL